MEFVQGSFFLLVSYDYIQSLELFWEEGVSCLPIAPCLLVYRLLTSLWILGCNLQFGISTIHSAVSRALRLSYSGSSVMERVSSKGAHQKGLRWCPGVTARAYVSVENSGTNGASLLKLSCNFFLLVL